MVHIESLKEEKCISMGASDIFDLVYEQLDLLEFFGKSSKQKSNYELLKEIIFCHLEEPASKRKRVEIIKKQRNREFHLDRLYRMMDKVYKHREQIKHFLRKNKLF